MPRELTVSVDGERERLDKYLARHLTGMSRSKIQKLIDQGSVTLNSTVVVAHHALHEGDRIVILDKSVAIEEKPMPRDVPQPEILFENDSVLVINKPAGLTVHPSDTFQGPTLVDWLKRHDPGITAIGDAPELRPGIVHRLDRDVSGVMVIAKTQAAFEHLKRQFQDRTVEKQYIALVHGIPKSSSGTIDFNIARSQRMHGRMAAHPLLPAYAGTEEGMAEGQGRREGRDAVTHYTVERHIKNNALLRITIETGRTHQIRVHLKAIGHPIVGDPVYTTKTYRHKQDKLNRPFLHAEKLAFTDLDGKRREFTAPLPGELRRFL
jgi:23S rRNA pseudouridine1911/1915/1917 synthase